VDPRDRELLTGMGNCYEACHEDFEGTVDMVAGARRRSSDDVRQTLWNMKARYSADPEYRTLRARLPPEFPF
jgi:hypothetical protein